MSTSSHSRDGLSEPSESSQDLHKSQWILSKSQGPAELSKGLKDLQTLCKAQGTFKLSRRPDRPSDPSRRSNGPLDPSKSTKDLWTLQKGQWTFRLSRSPTLCLLTVGHIRNPPRKSQLWPLAESSLSGGFPGRCFEVQPTSSLGASRHYDSPNTLPSHLPANQPSKAKQLLTSFISKHL